MLAIGIPLLFLLHVLDLVAQFVVYSIGVGGVAPPFVIWLVFAFFFSLNRLYFWNKKVFRKGFCEAKK